MFRQQADHRLAAGIGLVQSFLPALPGPNAGVRVHIQEDFVGQPRLLLDQPRLDRDGLAAIAAGMTQKHPRHNSPPIRTGSSRFRCAATATSTADRGEAKVAHTPSPVCLNMKPPCASIAPRNTSSWAASAARIPSASASHRRVEPSTSVNKNVTTPAGAAARSADTPAESHNGQARPRTSAYPGRSPIHVILR